MAAHYGIPESVEKDLFTTWAEASKIFPTITKFFWGDIDLRWLPEACISSPRHKGFYTVRHFIEGQTMPGSGLMNILQWREQILAGKTVKGNGPLDVAEELRLHAEKTLDGLVVLRKKPLSNDEFNQTLADIQTMVHLGRYYAFKIRGACELALFDANQGDKHRDAAVKELEIALANWQAYAAAYTKQYKQPILYNRVGWVDIPALTKKVEADIQMARDWKPGTIQADKIKPAGADQPFRK